MHVHPVRNRITIIIMYMHVILIDWNRNTIIITMYMHVILIDWNKNYDYYYVHACNPN